MDWADDVTGEYKPNAVSDLMVTIAELSDPEIGASPGLIKFREDGGLRKFNLT